MKYLLTCLLSMFMLVSVAMADCKDVKTKKGNDGVYSIYAEKVLEKGTGEVPFYWQARVAQSVKDGKSYYWLALMLFHNENDELELNLHMLDQDKKRFFPVQYIYQYQTKQDLKGKGFDLKDLSTHRIAVEQMWFLMPQDFGKRHSGKMSFLLVNSRGTSHRIIEIDSCYFKRVFEKLTVS